jgi:hypothetical protein
LNFSSSQTRTTLGEKLCSLQHSGRRQPRKKKSGKCQNRQSTNRQSTNALESPALWSSRATSTERLARHLRTRAAARQAHDRSLQTLPMRYDANKHLPKSTRVLCVGDGESKRLARHLLSGALPEGIPSDSPTVWNSEEIPLLSGALP